MQGSIGGVGCSGSNGVMNFVSDTMRLPEVM